MQNKLGSKLIPVSAKETIRQQAFELEKELNRDIDRYKRLVEICKEYESI